MAANPNNAKPATKPRQRKGFHGNQNKQPKASNSNSTDASSLLPTNELLQKIGLNQSNYFKVLETIQQHNGTAAVTAFLAQISNNGNTSTLPARPLMSIKQKKPSNPAAVAQTARPNTPNADAQKNSSSKDLVKKQPPPKQAVPRSKVVSNERKPAFRTPAISNDDHQIDSDRNPRSASNGPTSTNNNSKISQIDDVFRRIKNKNNRILVLLRGCPGSGKTTLAKKIQQNGGVILSADDFFMRDGKYEFDPLKLPEAHACVRFKTLEYMQIGVSPIIIDNTNLESWEMEPYMLQSVKLHYYVALIEPETPWRYNARMLAKLNTHQISFRKICEMLEKFDHRINVHVLRKLIQPKIDIYKQQKVSLNLKNEAKNTVSQSETLFPVGQVDVGKDSGNAKQKPDAAKEVAQGYMKDLLDIDFVCPEVVLEKISSKNNDWKLPPFPGSPEKSSVREIQESSKSKKTVPIDFLTDEINDFMIISDETCSSKTSERSTSKSSELESGLEAIRREDGVRSLKLHFPYIPTDDLNDLITRCDGDVHWAANTLLDSGYKWQQNDDADKPGDSCKTESCFDSDYDGCEDNDSDDENYSAKSSSSETDTILTGVEDSRLIMRIDPIFAMQLEQRFGPVGFHVATESYYGNDLSVAIDKKTARKIHSFWSDSLTKKFEREEDTLKEMINDESYAEHLQEVEDANIAAKLNAEERDPNFPVLTTKALLLHDAQKKFPDNTEGLSSKIKRQQLHDMFPKIDRQAVNNVFNANNGNLVETIHAIEISFSPLKKPELVVAPEHIEELEKKWLKIAEQESRLMCHDKSTGDSKPVTQAVVDPTYEDLRAEATVHYHRRQEFFEKAQEAHGKNLRGVASYYSQQGHLHSQKLYEANKRVKQIILEKMNAGHKEHTLDLHMLHVQEAMEILSTFLDQKKKELKSSGAATLVLNLITGKGIHSEQGVPRIKPAVVDFLHRHNYRMSDVNGGELEICLMRADLE